MLELERSPVTVTLVLPGPPRTKKTSNTITMVGKRKVVKPSEAWIAWRDQVQRWFYEQPARFRQAFPLPVASYNATAFFFRDALRGDAVGYYQGVADVLQDVGILTDDVQITQWDGSRLCRSRANPRVEITLTPLGDGE